MSYKNTYSHRSSTTSFTLGLQPALPWTAILVFGLLSALFIFAGAGKILNLAFPIGAFAVGVLLYFRAPILYHGFVWWMWFLTPLVRRLSDWKSGFTDPSPILLAPYFVTFVTLITLWRNLPKVSSQGGLPFILSLSSLFYGLCVGLIYRQPIPVCIAFLDWLVPVLLGFHLFANWRDYPSYRQNIQRVFLWGVLIMGIYGAIQFLVAPEWDRFWLIKADFASGGRPEPLQLNVWSTMASNRPFGTVMMAGLLLLAIDPNKGLLGLPATAFGYLAFLLTRKRTTWISWFLGLIILTGSLKAKTQMRVIVAVAMTALLVVPLVTIEPFATSINSRFDTFSNLEEDNSANTRKEIFNNTINQALTSFLGSGIGGPSFDSGVLSMLLDLGWLGALFYLSGMVGLLFRAFQMSPKSADPLPNAARAIAFATFVQIPLGRPHIEVQGTILWGFLGIAIAGKKYYQNKLDSFTDSGN